LILARAFFGIRNVVAASNLALRHQLALFHRSVRRTRHWIRDRIFWVWLSRVPPKKSVLVVSTGLTQRWFGDRRVVLNLHDSVA
jgi:hypothetical protein